MSLRCGLTTGTCAAAAAKAAVMVLSGGAPPEVVEVRLPSGQGVCVPIVAVAEEPDFSGVTASVRKDAGDDPDVTHGLEVRATVTWQDAPGVSFVAGEGVGIVTKPGLQVPPGEPAINPVPRQMIAAAIRELTARGVRVTLSIPGGREIAAKTFNPRLGIEGGLSILGTTGIVRPYCTQALRDALMCALDVAAACGVIAPVLAPGNVGARAASRHFSLAPEQVIEVGNEWGFVIDLLPRYPFSAVMLLGHPGKLAKLAANQWDTHSSRSDQATHFVNQLACELLGHPAADRTTTEGIFSAISASERTILANALARRVRLAVENRLAQPLQAAVFLVNMAGECLGRDGVFKPWQ